MSDRVRLRDLKNADARASNQQRRIEEVRDRQGKKYPQKANSTTIPALGESALTSKPIQAKVTASVFDRVQLAAERQGLSKAEWLRQAIEYFLEKNGD